MELDRRVNKLTVQPKLMNIPTGESTISHENNQASKQTNKQARKFVGGDAKNSKGLMNLQNTWSDNREAQTFRRERGQVDHHVRLQLL